MILELARSLLFFYMIVCPLDSDVINFSRGWRVSVDQMELVFGDFLFFFFFFFQTWSSPCLTYSCVTTKYFYFILFISNIPYIALFEMKDVL